MSQYSYLLDSDDRRAKFVDIEAGMVSARQNSEEIENYQLHEVIVEAKPRPAVEKIQNLNQHRYLLTDDDDGRGHFVDIEAGLQMEGQNSEGTEIENFAAQSAVGEIPLQKAQMLRPPWSNQRPQNNRVACLRKQQKMVIPREVKNALNIIYRIENEVAVKPRLPLQKETLKNAETQRSDKNLKEIGSWITCKIRAKTAFLIFQLIVAVFVCFIIVLTNDSAELRWKAAQVASVILIMLLLIGIYLYNLLLKKRKVIVHEHLA